ncbi:hypothetical protein D3C86_2096160 [compost metagenome]
MPRNCPDIAERRLGVQRQPHLGGLKGNVGVRSLLRDAVQQLDISVAISCGFGSKRYSFAEMIQRCHNAHVV